MTHQHGTAVEPVDLRIASLREVADGLRHIRAAAMGSDEEPDSAASGPLGSPADLPLGMLAAMMALGDLAANPDAAASDRPGRPTNPTAMAGAIAAALRPARLATGDSPATTAPANDDAATARDQTGGR